MSVPRRLREVRSQLGMRGPLVDQDVDLDGKRVRRQGRTSSPKSYPFQISMYHRLTMYVYQSPRNIFELSLCALANSLMVPFVIHSDTIANWSLLIVIPRNDSTFGWRRVFHVTTSLQNLCTVNISCSTNNFGKAAGTYACDLDKVARRVHPQYLDGNMAALVIALPHVSEPAAIQ